MKRGKTMWENAKWIGRPVEGLHTGNLKEYEIAVDCTLEARQVLV